MPLIGGWRKANEGFMGVKWEHERTKQTVIVSQRRLEYVVDVDTAASAGPVELDSFENKGEAVDFARGIMKNHRQGFPNDPYGIDTEV